MPAFNGVQSGTTYWKLNQKEFCFVRADKAERFDSFGGVIENVSFKEGEYEGKDTLEICIWFVTDGLRECVQLNAHTNIGNAVCKILAQAAKGDRLELQVWKYDIPAPADLPPKELMKWKKAACCVAGRVNGEKVKCGKDFVVSGLPAFPEPDSTINGKQVEFDYTPVVDVQVSHVRHLYRVYRENGQQQQQQQQQGQQQQTQQQQSQWLHTDPPAQRFPDDDDIPF